MSFPSMGSCLLRIKINNLTMGPDILDGLASAIPLVLTNPAFLLWSLWSSYIGLLLANGR